MLVPWTYESLKSSGKHSSLMQTRTLSTSSILCVCTCRCYLIPLEDIFSYIRHNISTVSYLRGDETVNYFLLFGTIKCVGNFFFCLKAICREGFAIYRLQPMKAGCGLPQPKSHLSKMQGHFFFSHNKMEEICKSSFPWSLASDGVLWVWKERGLSRLSYYEHWELFWTTPSSQVCSSSKSSLLATSHSKNCNKKGRITGDRSVIHWELKKSWCFSAASLHHHFT